jgi:hypothetical protein
MKSKLFSRAFGAIVFAVAIVIVACQVHLKRQFAEKLRQDYAEYDSNLELSIPFVVKHSVKFSRIDGCENTHVYILGYHRIVDTTTIISDPVITVPAS